MMETLQNERNTKGLPLIYIVYFSIMIAKNNIVEKALRSPTLILFP